MARKYPANVIQQGIDVLEGLKQITPPITIDGWDSADLEADLASAAPISNQMSALKGQITTLRNQRDDIYNAIWFKIKRLSDISRDLAIYGGVSK